MYLSDNRGNACFCWHCGRLSLSGQLSMSAKMTAALMMKRTGNTYADLILEKMGQKDSLYHSKLTGAIFTPPSDSFNHYNSSPLPRTRTITAAHFVVKGLSK